MDTLTPTDRQKQLLQERMKEKIRAIAAIEDDLPSVVIIHDLRTRSVAYMSKRGLNLLGVSLEYLQTMEQEYFDKYFNPQDAKNYHPKFLDLLDRCDLEHMFSFFQQVRGNEQEAWGWYLSSSKLLMLDDEDTPLLSITCAHPIENLRSASYKIERLLDENEMVRKEFKKFNSLTTREREMIKYLAQGLNAPVIAEMLYISESTVEQHRKNIKKKLEIKNLPELVHFAMAFDMI